MLYILYGEDDYSLEEALEEIKKSLGDQLLLGLNTTVLEGQKLTLDQLKVICETVPFMAEKRLVIVKGLLGRFEVEGKSGRPKQSAQDKPQNDLRVLVDCLSQIPETTIIVLVDSFSLKSSNPLLKELFAKATVKSFPLLKGNRLQQWVNHYLARQGGIISPQAVNLMVELVGSNLRVMASEVDKLILFTAGRRIEEEDVKQVVSYAQETSIFTMIDAILEFKAGVAGQLLQHLLQRGAPPAYLLVVLARQARTMLRINELRSQGSSEREIQSKLGVTSEFAWRRMRERANRYSLDRLKDLYHRLLEADLAIKTGKYDGELALNLLIADLCQKAGK